MNDDSATFLANFPPIQSAIKIGQDGMRIQFDVPESEMAKAIGIMTMRGEVLEVTIRRRLQNRQEQADGTEDENIVPSGPKRKSRWKATKE